MSALLLHIKSVLFDFNGVLVKKDDYLVDDELRNLKIEFLSNMDMEHASADKINLHKDVQNISRDIKKVIKRYKSPKDKV